MQKKEAQKTDTFSEYTLNDMQQDFDLGLVIIPYENKVKYRK